jgi:tRNA(Ile)-lysidine synthase
LAQAAADLGRVRARRDAALAAHLARSVALDPRGFARIDGTRFGAAGDSIGTAALARLVRTIGAADHVRRRAVEPVWQAIRDGTLGAGRTVGGCRLIASGRTVIVCREAGRVVDVARFDGAATLWDRRFTLGLAEARRLRSRLAIRALGEVPAARLPAAAAAVPAPVRAAWPALWRGARLAAVPHLGYNDPDFATLLRGLTVKWTPAAPLASATFAVVTGPRRII